MAFLIVKHIDIEGPGTLGDFLQKKNIRWDVVELGRGERLPQSPKDYAAVVILGGPMNVYEEDKYPFLAEENSFIKECLRQEIPCLGICLGSQLLAKAAGAKVVRSPVKEIGWYQIHLTEMGKKDPMFQNCRSPLPVFHWHGDMFNIPQEGVLLATASGCPHQAFKVGTHAYGLQFHVEVTGPNTKEWHDEYGDKDLSSLGGSIYSMLQGYETRLDLYSAQALKIYENFLEMAEETVD